MMVFLFINILSNVYYIFWRFFYYRFSTDFYKMSKNKQQITQMVSLGTNRGHGTYDSEECKIVCSGIVDGKSYYGQNAMKPQYCIKHLYTC